MKESIPDKKGPILRNLLFFGGIMAIIEGIFFLIAIFDLITFDIQPGTIFQNNWLILIFKVGAGFAGVHIESLYVLNFLDIFLMVVFGIILSALYPILRQISKILSIIAICILFAGIVLFIITGNIGRSAFLVAFLIISIIILRSNNFGKNTAYLGILASIFLLTGDITLGLYSTIIITVIFGIGYICLIIWFILIGWKFCKIAKIREFDNKKPI